MEEEQELKHVCRFCSKSFYSGRSLGGHMRSHMINDITAQPDGSKLTKKKLPDHLNNGPKPDSKKKTLRIGTEKLFINEQQDQEGEEEELESWASAINSHSDDNENSASVAIPPNRRKRSQRKTRQIVGITADSCSASLCFANTTNNNNSCSVSEIEQEQEEVAICLMMLSRDVNGFNSVTESSDNNSVFLTETRKTELSVSGPSKTKKSQLDDESVIQNSVTESGKRKLSYDFRFECTTCNKIFHSYQALGGHRASHKKNKGCCNSRIDRTETVQFSPEIMTKTENNSVDSEAKKGKGIHICPVCFKVFSSGQALGGHKRSHLVAKNEQTLGVEEPIRDFLDLNLPAPCEEDSNGVMGFDQWWISSTQKHESLLGLISN